MKDESILADSSCSELPYYCHHCLYHLAPLLPSKTTSVTFVCQCLHYSFRKVFPFLTSFTISGTLFKLRFDLHQL